MNLDFPHQKNKQHRMYVHVSYAEDLKVWSKKFNYNGKAAHIQIINTPEAVNKY